MPGDLLASLSEHSSIVAARLLGATLHGPNGSGRIESGPRIGITKAVDTPWRFHIEANPWVSKAPAPK